MNNKGLVYVHHGATHWIRSKPKEQWTEGITEGIANLHTLRFANNAAGSEGYAVSLSQRRRVYGRFLGRYPGECLHH